MKKLIKYFSCCCLLLMGMESAAQANSLPPQPDILKDSLQLLVVVTDSWDTYQGHMQKFERANSQQAWRAVGKAWPVVVGKTGLAWADNLQTYSLQGPVKKEGDKKAPAGVFALGTAFGFSPQPDKQLKLNYIPVTPSIECVDDSQSRYYGRIVDNTKLPDKDWKSSEILIDHPVAYNKGIVVDYNTDGKMIGAGSCIFVHIKADHDLDGTVGCTAMQVANLSKIWDWLDPKAQPVMVQLPKDEYLKLQKLWRLPHYPQ
jgi:D-alanyl-D-alanine dipeptidase